MKNKAKKYPISTEKICPECKTTKVENTLAAFKINKQGFHVFECLNDKCGIKFLISEKNYKP